MTSFPLVVRVMSDGVRVIGKYDNHVIRSLQSIDGPLTFDGCAFFRVESYWLDVSGVMHEGDGVVFVRLVPTGLSTDARLVGLFGAFGCGE